MNTSREYKSEINKLWDECILSIIVEMAEDLGLKYKRLSYLERRLKRVYGQLKNHFITTYMSIESPDIDRHKIAACALKAIMMVKPLYIPLRYRFKFIFTKKKLYEIINPELTEADYKYIILANEYLAWSVAASIIDGFIKISENDKRLKHDILLPDPFPEDDDDYLLDLCICLHYTKSRYISTIMLSNTFFLLEKYSCRKIQCENIEKAYIEDLMKYESEKSEDEHRAYIERIRLNIK